MPIITRGGGGLVLPPLSNPATAADIMRGKQVYDAKGKLITGTYVPALNKCTWQQISEISSAGLAPKCWKIGDTKSIIINGKVGNTTFSNLSIDVFILGFNHNPSREGTNRIHFQIGKIGGTLVGLYDKEYSENAFNNNAFNINNSSSNSGGWKSSNMRNTILGNGSTPTRPLANSLLAALPSDLRAVIKPCTKYSDNTGGGNDTASYVTSTTDYLFLLAEFEYQGVREYANSAEQNYQMQYDYYKAGNRKARYMYNRINDGVHVWCRSSRILESAYFCITNSDGDSYYTHVYTSYGLAPGFCV